MEDGKGKMAIRLSWLNNNILIHVFVQMCWLVITETNHKALASTAHDSSTDKYAQHNQKADEAENP
jgi:hypothetical protein